MKKLLILFFASLVLCLPANASTTKQISVKSLTPLTTIGSVTDISGVLTRGSEIIIFGSRDDKSYVRAIDLSGKELWTFDLSPELHSIATAGSIDISGNIWIAGSASRTVNAPAETLIPINPDGIVANNDESSYELNEVVLWKIPSELSSPITFINQQESAIMINSIATDTNGVSLVGEIATEKGSSGFLMNTDNAGTYSQLVKIGSLATKLNSILRNKDGSKTLFGASSDSLAGKKLLGITDGVIISVNSKNEISNIVRSSESKTKRSWNSASNSLLLGGSLIRGSITQSTITKFSKNYAPQWTYKFDSTGSTYTSGTNRALISSTAAILPIRGWAPKSARVLLLTFDTKGAISEAFSAPTRFNEVFGLIDSKELGVLVTAVSEQTIVAFLAK